MQRLQRLLTVEHLHLQYGEKVILNDVDFSIDNIPGHGQVVSLVGPSGIGKTQLFRCIAGLQKPTSGQVLLNTERKRVVAGDVGVVFQNYPLFEHRTAWANLKIAARHTGKTDADIKPLVEDFGFTVEQLKVLYPAQLSGGQRQRVAIIQQILCSEHFFLDDEPFSGLDVIMKQKACDLITKVANVNELNTFIITTHDVPTGVAISDTVIVMGHHPSGQGATIIKQIDLIERGLAWHPDVKHHPNFYPTILEIEALFQPPLRAAA